jgi:PAS domain S-box-containing protein
MKILIAEDDVNSRVFLERALLSQGYTVESAANGVEALEKAYLSPPDLIISDIMMPGMDGFELCRKVKTDERLHNVSFVFYTATYIEDKDEKLGMALGASRFLIKPMEPTEFFRNINEVIEEQQVGNIPLPDQLPAKITELDRMQVEVYARKLDKKVRELEKERAALRRSKVQLEQKMTDLEREITERKKTEEALRESQIKYVDLFENANDMIFTMDLDCTITSANHMTCNSLGYECEEIIGRNLRTLLTEEGFRFVCDQMQSALGERAAVTALQPYVVEVITKSGDRLVIEVKTRFIGADDRITGVHGIARDVTERKKMEKELKKRVKDLEDFYDMAIGRELKMIELKNEIKELKEELSKYKKQ